MNDCDEGNDDDLSKPIYIRYKSTWHLRQFSKFDVHFQYRNYQFSKTGLYVCIVLVCCLFCADDGYQWSCGKYDQYSTSWNQFIVIYVPFRTNIPCPCVCRYYQLCVYCLLPQRRDFSETAILGYMTIVYIMKNRIKHIELRWSADLIINPIK